MTFENEVQKLANWINKAEKILFITGAGVSVDSGLPTYRGVAGLYHDDHVEEGLRIEQILSGSVFRQRPDLTWKYLWQIIANCRHAEPNTTHHFIAETIDAKPQSWLLTQNIDGLHRRAGTSNLIEIHGGSCRLTCMECGKTLDLFDEMDRYLESQLPCPPKCAKCNGILRPDVVLFEEMLPEEALMTYEDVLMKMPDLVIAIGTSAVFPYIIAPFEMAARCAIPTVEINPGTSTLSAMVDLHIKSGASEVFSAVKDLIRMVKN